MIKRKKHLIRICSTLLAFLIVFSNAFPAFATENGESISDVIPIETVEQDGTSAEIIGDENTEVSEDETEPFEVSEDETEPFEASEDEAEVIEEPALPELPELAIESFTDEPETLSDGRYRLSVLLNRTEITANYQWQVKVSGEAQEPLFDYSSCSDTSYYFPYFDLTEAELLEINPEATWAGIEMYLEAVEEANWDYSAVHIENGTPNTFFENTVAPEWTDIDGANDYEYIFYPEYQNAVYRCVITAEDAELITDEAEVAK